MSTAPVNPYEISLDELRQLADGQPLPLPEPVTPESVTPEGEEQQLPPRDEKGRFVAAEPEAEPEGTPEPEGGPVEEYTATIDIGDGAGVQVFSAPTKDELLAKLVEAQENATRKIRELSTKKPEPVIPTVKEPNPDEELALAQEFLANPSVAFDKLYKQRREEERQREAEAQRQADEAKAAVDAAAKKFIAATPDFYEHPKNAARIAGWLAVNSLPETFENIQAAYNDLAADGLLLPKPDPTPTTRGNSSGLSVRRSVAPPVKAPEDLSKLSKEELFARAGGYVY